MGIIENPKTLICTDQAPKEIQHNCQWVIKNGYLPDLLLAQIVAGYRSFFWYPGRYLIPSASRSITIGPDVIFSGMNPITLNPRITEPTQPDPETMTVFFNPTDLPETTSASSSQIGYIQTLAGASGITVSDIALDGYAVLRAVAARNCTFSRIIVNNYRGTYPSGSWCNMGYGTATASVWIYKACSDIELNDISIQFSSHHGFAVHSGDNGILSQNITLNRVRSLYAGCGMLRGEDKAHIDKAKQLIPERDGHGCFDWSVCFDGVENASVRNLIFNDCVALSGWKSNFYTEPRATSGARSGIVFNRCISVDAAQRSVIPGSNPPATAFIEGEGAGFNLQGAVCNGCLSWNSLKVGYSLCSEDIDPIDSSGYRIRLVECIDIGSPLGVDIEMNASAFISGDRCTFLENGNRALRLYGWTNIQFTNNRIITTNSQVPPVLLGAMNREFCGMSRNPDHQAAYAPGGKYDSLTISMSNSAATGTVSGLDPGTPVAEVKSGSRFNGTSLWKPEGNLNGVTFSRTEEPADLETQILQKFGLVAGPAIATPEPEEPVEPEPEPSEPEPVEDDSDEELYIVLEKGGKQTKKVHLD
jgi:hypothetical protein